MRKKVGDVMKIVTWNLRCQWKEVDGVNAFIHRAGFIYEKTMQELPDVIAFQEIVPQSLELLQRMFAGVSEEQLQVTIQTIIQIEDNLKLYYYRGMKEWNNEKGFLTDTCLTAQDKYKAYLDYFRIAY